jgi:colanic acid/amylovoran biosynthesis glycosyltransferase
MKDDRMTMDYTAVDEKRIQVPNVKRGNLLVVTAPVVRAVNDVYEVDADTANNLRSYLENFSHVTLACPLQIQGSGQMWKSLPFRMLEDGDRFSYVPLPYSYREDRHFRYYRATRDLLRLEILKSDYLLFSPHSIFDWPVLAALEAIKMKRNYVCESDWDHESVWRVNLNAMPLGVNRVRKTIWMYIFLRDLYKCLFRSSLALLQGQDVFDAYKGAAPNPHKVLNVQVTSEDHISSVELDAKLAAIGKGVPLVISYAGRLAPMKGPLDWLRAVASAVDAGVKLRATWFGDGPLMPQMQQEIARLGIQENVTLAGVVSREEIMARLRETDIFLFCHKTGESPRCLVEALATGCALVGYGTAYSRDLTASFGGSDLANIGDWKALAEKIVSLYRDRPKLSRLVEAAAASGKLLDRDPLMQNRIDLIKKNI